VCCVCVYYYEAPSEQRAARCIVAPGVQLERGLPRDVESLHPTRMHGSDKPMRDVAKSVAMGRSHKGVCLMLRGKRIQMPSGTRQGQVMRSAVWRPMSREHARPQPPTGSRRYGGARGRGASPGAGRGHRPPNSAAQGPSRTPRTTPSPDQLPPGPRWCPRWGKLSAPGLLDRAAGPHPASAGVTGVLVRLGWWSTDQIEPKEGMAGHS
jgi:hypothetical protein